MARRYRPGRGPRRAPRTNRKTSEATVAVVEAPPLGVLKIPATLAVGDLASMMRVDPIDVIKQFMRNGYMITINEIVDQEVAIAVARSFGCEAEELDEEEDKPGSLVVSADQGELEPRAPVVTILGHVDHGKTTLLDAIRNTKVAEGEVGGITQRIGAYQVDHDGGTITFLDTPGHEAFTAMRARGAQLTDIAILVVAADDGIMPQTIEAIDHVKAAGVPIVVAINKIDKPDADQEKAKRQLAEHELLIEEWGGDIVSVPVSALTGEGIPTLLENLLVVAEVGDLKANPNRDAWGVVVEASLDKSRGPVATVLVQTGTLRVGDHMVIGDVRGRVKAMLSFDGKRIEEAGPSRPVEVLGISGLPPAGEVFTVVADDKASRQLVEERTKDRQQRGHPAGVSLEDVHTRIQSGEEKGLNLIVKADTQGSIDAVRNVLDRLNGEKIRVNVIHAGSGTITENDVNLAAASSAIVLGFNSRPEQGARTLAAQEGVDLRFYDIIYRLAEDIEKALEGLLEPVTQDVLDGYATVRVMFTISRRKVAGIYVNQGRIPRSSEIHVKRGDEKIFVGKIASLKHFKDDVREVATGFEGGIMLEGFQDIHEGDILEAHHTEQVGVA